jgi:thiamine-phosphate pyrophosphorylase
MKPIVCYVTDRKSIGINDTVGSVLAKIRAAAAAGADWVQIRERDFGARDLLSLARGAVEACGRAARVIVNDRLDVAIASGAAGVHLGEKSLPAREVVRWCRSGNAHPEFLVGVSCHSRESAREAESAGASYIFFGPVFDTPAKRIFGQPQGIAKLTDVCRGVRLPVIAIGGVNEENAAECIRAGAAGIAAIRLFQEEQEQEKLRATIARLHDAAR